MEGLRSSTQIHWWQKQLHGGQLRLCQLTVLRSDPVHNQSEFLLFQTEYDLGAKPHSVSKWGRRPWYVLYVVIIFSLTDCLTYRVPLPIVVLLPVEDLLLSSHRQSDPSFGNVQGKMGAPPSGGSEEQQSFWGSGPDVQGKVRPGDENEKSTMNQDVKWENMNQIHFHFFEWDKKKVLEL